MERKISWLAVYAITAAAVLTMAAWGSRAVTVLAENAPVQRSHCVVIDAGHGGVDGGATSCTGKLESTYNLEIAMRLRDLFHFLGYDTKMIRTEDISIYTKGETIAQKKISDLKERVRIVNETQQATLISIHQNFYPDSRYHGAQVFYANAGASADLAKSLQSSFAATINLGNRRSSKKCSGVYLMDHIEKTGVLVECGFLSNPEEASLLETKAYQQNLCCVIAASVSSFLSNT